MAKSSRTGKTSTSTDPVTAYAEAVASGKIVAGPHVRGACKRHLEDLKEGPKRGLHWDVEKANRAIGFFRDVLFVDIVAGDTTEGEMKPFELIDWQAFIVGSLFGWLGPDGFRRFRMAFVETGKGSGKSPLAAGVGMYMLAADGEFRAEVYAAAQKKDQAKVLFRDAVAMVEKSPALDERLHLSGGVEKTNIAYLEKGSFFRPISTEERGKGQSGPRPHCGLLDEIHEHSTNAMVEFMRAGTKGRNQALIFMITNSGSDRTTVCYDYHDYGAKVCAGQIEDDALFAYICGLDEHDDPFKDESCWPKANPSLGITITHKYLREQVVQARGMPSKQNIVLRLNFCVWTDAESTWIGKEIWDSCESKPRPELLAGRTAYGGLDLSGKKDLTAHALVFSPDEDGIYDAFVDFWTPKDTLKERSEIDRVPYPLWVEQGFLNATPGKTVDYCHVAKRIAELSIAHEIEEIGFDPHRIEYLIPELAEEGVDSWTPEAGIDSGQGIKLTPHNQGFISMGLAVEAAEEIILNGKLRVWANPVLRWNMASTVLDEDAAGNRKPNKRKATGRIDGTVALIMALRLALMANSEETEPQAAWL